MIIASDQTPTSTNQAETSKAAINTIRDLIAQDVNTPMCVVSAEKATTPNLGASPKTIKVKTIPLTQHQAKPIRRSPLNQQNRAQAAHSQANKLPTPVKWEKLELWLKGYDHDKKALLINGFKHGFHLGYLGPRSAQESPNLRTAIENKEIVNEKILSELKAGRIAGPFDEKPSVNFKTSPLGIVPKKVPGEFRLIHHLSWPRTTGSSVNDGIPDEYSSVQYSGIQEAISKIKSLGRGCYLAKTDVKAAFRIVPIRPDDYELLGFSWNGRFYYDMCLPFGASSSCQKFELLGSALEWIAINKLGCRAMVHILDDFLFIDDSYEGCMQSLRSFLEMCSAIGIPIADDKTFYANTSMTFVGISLCTIRMESSLPLDKLQKGKKLLSTFICKNSCKLRELQSLIGFLNFCCSVITCGRAFLRRLINLTIGIIKPYFHIRLNKAVKADLQLWLSFLEWYNGKSMFLNEKFLSSNLLKLYTDSAKSLGYGAVYGPYWFYGPFPPVWKTFNITFLELFPIVLAVHIWAPLWKNHSILFFTDNLALVSIINNQTSKNPQIMGLLRILILACLQNNIVFQAKHISGVKNTLADCLSRLQVEKFRQLSPNSKQQPDQVPQHLLPENFLIP